MAESLIPIIILAGLSLAFLVIFYIWATTASAKFWANEE